jgi:hypothetical protein
MIGFAYSFTTGKAYLYSYASAGAGNIGNIEQMKRLAVSGEGLNAFISTTVKKLYVH